MQEILGLVRRCVTDYDMIQEGETVAVGVSGGKDSLVTLTALARLSKFYQKPFKVVGHHGRNGRAGHELRCRGRLLRSARRGVHPRERADLRGRLFGAQGEKSLLAVRQAPPRCAFDRDERARHQKRSRSATTTTTRWKHCLMNLLFEGRHRLLPARDIPQPHGRDADPPAALCEGAAGAQCRGKAAIFPSCTIPALPTVKRAVRRSKSSSSRSPSATQTSSRSSLARCSGIRCTAGM